MTITQTLTSARQILEQLGIADKPCGYVVGSRYEEGTGPRITTYSPIDGAPIKEVGTASAREVAQAIDAAAEAFTTWRQDPR